MQLHRMFELLPNGPNKVFSKGWQAWPNDSQNRSDPGVAHSGFLTTPDGQASQSYPIRVKPKLACAPMGEVARPNYEERRSLLIRPL